MQRCSWVDLENEQYVRYHDDEWGVLVVEDRKLFEFLVLESFQAGLSWSCILKKREAFRRAMDNFDPVLISRYDEAKVIELLQNKEIIRNRRKIEAAIINASIFLEIQKEWGSFSRYIWHFTDGQVVYFDGVVRAMSPLSDEVSKDLQKRGMKFVGTIIIYSYLQAIGIINDHERCCFKYQENNN